jgi:hypothetical protein
MTTDQSLQQLFSRRAWHKNTGIRDNTARTEKVFEALSHLPFIREYTLIGGSALAMQIHHRLSENLGFCIWTRNVKKEKPEVDWPSIQGSTMYSFSPGMHK